MVTMTGAEIVATWDAAVRGAVPAGTEPPPAERPVHDRVSAMRFLWSLRRVRTKIAAVEADYAQELAALNHWREGELADLTSTATYLDAELTAWHAREFERDPSAKTIKLPHGTLVSRAGTTVVEVQDEAQALEAAKQAGLAHVVRVKESLDKTALRHHLEATGEVLPGTEIVKKPRTFTVRLADATSEEAAE